VCTTTSLSIARHHGHCGGVAQIALPRMAGRGAPRCEGRRRDGTEDLMRPTGGGDWDRAAPGGARRRDDRGRVLGCWVGYVSGVILGCWVWVGGLPGVASLVGASTFFILNFLKFSFQKKIERFGGLKRFETLEIF
jgi:hypothetical protein